MPTDISIKYNCSKKDFLEDSLRYIEGPKWISAETYKGLNFLKAQTSYSTVDLHKSILINAEEVHNLFDLIKTSKLNYTYGDFQYK